MLTTSVHQGAYGTFAPVKRAVGYPEQGEYRRACRNLPRGTHNALMIEETDKLQILQLATDKVRRRNANVHALKPTPRCVKG